MRSDVCKICRKSSITPQTNALTELCLPRYKRLTNLYRTIAMSNSPDYNFNYVEGFANTLAFLCLRRLLIDMQFRTEYSSSSETVTSPTFQYIYHQYTVLVRSYP